MNTRQARGFTIPELMITLGIVAIVLTTAVPSISSTIRDNRLTTQLNSMLADIHLARSEAAKRDVRVILCRTDDPNATNPRCNGTTQVWSTGYIVFADDGNYANNYYDPGTDTLLRRGLATADGVERRTNATWNRNLEFNPNGSTNEGGIAYMSICDNRGSEYGRQIMVGLNGIPKVTSSNIGDCTP